MKTEDLSFSTVRFIDVNGQRIVLKTSNAEEMDVTKDQIHFLVSLENEKLKSKFPKVIDYKVSNSEVWYTMEYIEMISLDAALVKNKIDVNIIASTLENVLKFVRDNLYTNYRSDCDIQYLKKVHQNRVIKRVKQFKNLCSDIKPLVEADQLIINDKKCLAPYTILEILEKRNFFNLLNPKKLVMTHGDLEANHIFFKPNDPSNFKLIDPRMPTEGGDPAYDLAKLRQSIFNRSHDMFVGNYSYYEDYSNKTPQFGYSTFSERKNGEFERLKSIYNYHLQDMEEQFNNITLRVKLAEAAHFLSAPPYFVSFKHPKNLAKLLYLKGVLLINELYQEVIE
ncbi:aminoglycoside phosphotransferase family protein [Paenibacillus motobuensis]|uniref:phosphotransferase n=1 Tax=Paenibacillus TaxID=44249 RepID=UPI002040DC85|nr:MULTISPECIES: phosphotransferase [Paenibacillus]MCM3039601.1 aminoglycoside phosphotransferase family protein [Paenibacillus lutimineralis]MCM3646705.1 aminoglycoside phosphotransferase family protein [Paenibacillus motobuensis]